MATIQRRVLESGAVRYRAEIRIQGHPRRVRVFPKHSQAKTWAQQTEAELRNAQSAPTIRVRCTFDDLLETYVQRELPALRREKHRRRRCAQLRFWREHFGGRVWIDEIRRGHVVTGLWKLEQGQSDDERDRLLAAVADDPVLELFMLLALSTGARLGEIRGLRWDAIDFERQQAVLDQTKNGDRRVLPLHGLAMARLLAFRDEHVSRSPFIFAGPSGRPNFPRTRWKAALESAEIEDFRFHDLRHTAASYLAMNGATPAELADVLGHKTLQMVKRYTHFAEAHTHDLVRRMNERMIGGAS